MQTPNPIEPTIITFDSPIVNADETPTYDVSCGCTAVVPPGSRVMFMVFAAISMIIGCVLLFGLFKLAESMNWL